MKEILDAIPHRPPFLFLDRITESGDDFLSAEKFLDPALDFFKGHYPGFPIMPGVLTCESIFQAGSVLLSRIAGDIGDKIPVIARIKNAKFKKMVRPGDTLKLSVKITERIGDVYYLRGKAVVDGKTAVDVEFACTITEVEGK